MGFLEEISLIFVCLNFTSSLILEDYTLFIGIGLYSLDRIGHAPKKSQDTSVGSPVISHAHDTRLYGVPTGTVNREHTPYLILFPLQSVLHYSFALFLLKKLFSAVTLVART